MKKELLLVRHADARPSDGNERDAERQLSAKGYQDATRLGFYLREQQQEISVVLASTAQRARHTAEILMEQMRYSHDTIHLSENLYQGSIRSVMTLINEQPERVQKLMIVSHNPTLTYLAEYLSGEEVPVMEPGSFCLLHPLVDHWEEVAQQTVSFEKYLSPDQLRK